MSRLVVAARSEAALVGLPLASHLGAGAVQLLGALLAVLAAVTAVRAWRLHRSGDDPEVRSRWRSIGSWWGLSTVMVGVLLGGVRAAAAIGVLITLALATESVRLVRRRDPPGLTPARVLLALAVAGAAPVFLVATAWLPGPGDPPRACMGWLLTTLVLTGLGDSAQAWWGRRIGRRRLAPVISPGKTWEGLAGGVFTTALAAAWVVPLLTPLGREAVRVGLQAPPGAGPPVAAGGVVLPGRLVAAGLGVLVALAATLGDLTVSALKRGAGVKDSGTAVPGHGGLLDRFDSLSATAVLVWWVGRRIVG